MRFALLALAPILTLTACGPEPETPTPPAVPRKAPPAPPSATLEDRMRALVEKEKAVPVPFRTLHEAWGALLAEAAGTTHEAAIREKRETLEGRANLTYRELYRPLQEDLRRMGAERNPTGARDRLLAWTVPAELDIGGVPSADRARELETLDELIRLEACRYSLEGRYAAGDFTRDLSAELDPFRRSSRVAVRTAADQAFRALRRSLVAAANYRRFRNAPRDVRPVFGERPSAPVPTERPFSEKIPAEARKWLEESRRILGLLGRTSSLEEFRSLAVSGGSNVDRAVDAAGWLPVAHYYRAEWTYVAGDTLGALCALDEAIQRHPQFVEARLARARLYLEAELRDPANRELALLRRALPDSLRSHIAAARRAFTARETDEAVAAVDRAFRALPDDPSFLARENRPAEGDPDWADSGLTVETPTYVFKAEPSKQDGHEARLRRLADAAEVAHAWFPSIVRIDRAPEQKPRVFFFAGEESYAEFVEPHGEEALAGSAGRYDPKRRRLMLPDGPDEAETRRTLIHEAWHEYLDRSPGTLPPWLNEGLADYAGAAEIQEGRVAGVGLSQGRLWTIEAGFREGWRGLPFGEIMGASQREFYGTLRSLQYAQAWSMVSFFRHGEGGRHAGIFQSYLSRIAGGVPRAEAFERTFGKEDLPKMEEEWRAYVRGLSR